MIIFEFGFIDKGFLTIFKSICNTYWDALANVVSLVINSCISTRPVLTGSLDLLKLWLLSSGDKKEGTLEFPSKGLGKLLEMGDNEVAMVDGGYGS